MKKLLSLLLILSVFIACSDDDDKVQPELSVDTTDLSFGTTQENQSFTITSNVTWTVVSSEVWCTVTPPRV